MVGSYESRVSVSFHPANQMPRQMYCVLFEPDICAVCCTASVPIAQCQQGFLDSIVPLYLQICLEMESTSIMIVLENDRSTKSRTDAGASQGSRHVNICVKPSMLTLIVSGPPSLAFSCTPPQSRASAVWNSMSPRLSTSRVAIYCHSHPMGTTLRLRCWSTCPSRGISSAWGDYYCLTIIFGQMFQVQVLDKILVAEAALPPPWPSTKTTTTSVPFNLPTSIYLLEMRLTLS